MNNAKNTKQELADMTREHQKKTFSTFFATLFFFTAVAVFSVCQHGSAEVARSAQAATGSRQGRAFDQVKKSVAIASTPRLSAGGKSAAVQGRHSKHLEDTRQKANDDTEQRFEAKGKAGLVGIMLLAAFSQKNAE